MDSLFLPRFWSRLCDPDIKNILLCGCGGGFDFVHSLILYPELRRLGKNIFIGSYSFNDPQTINNEILTFGIAAGDGQSIAVKLVDSSATGSAHYCPEIHVCSFLDKAFPEDQESHKLYAYNARKFTISSLLDLYDHLIDKHNLDAIIVFV